MMMFYLSELPLMVHLYQMGHNVYHLGHICGIVTPGRSKAMEFLKRKRTVSELRILPGKHTV